MNTMRDLIGSNVWMEFPHRNNFFGTFPIWDSLWTSK
jgi:hypothetical protein